MRKIVISLVAAAAALAAVGVAIASHGTTSVAPVDATFSFTKERVDSRTCKASDGDTYLITHGRYAGTATSGSAALNGPASAQVKSVFNQTDSVGWVEGWVKVRGSERRAHLHARGILGSGNALNGFLAGGWAFGNLTGTFTPDGPFTWSFGKGDAVTSRAVAFGRVSCDRQEPTRPAVKLTVKGQVEALSATEIRVKPRDNAPSQACAIKAGVSPSTSVLAAPSGNTPGSTVEMGCGIVDNTMTLLKIKHRGGKDD